MSRFHSRFRSPAKRVSAGILGLLFVLCLPASLFAEAVGYSAQYINEVVELRLTEAGERVPEGERWTFADVPNIQGLEHHEASGLLYATAVSALNNVRLFELDLEAGTSEDLAFIGFSGSANLAFDDQGLLWISRSTGEIFSYDLVSETLTLETTMASGTPQDIAWWDGRLYVLVASISGIDPPVLAVLDPTTGELSDSRELTSLAGDAYELYFMDSLDIDADGGMWISFVSSPGIVDPPLYFGNTAYFSNPTDDTSPEIRRLETEIWARVPLAVTGQVTPVEVPALGELSLGLLVAFLGLAGLVSLRQG